MSWSSSRMEEDFAEKSFSLPVCHLWSRTGKQYRNSRQETGSLVDFRKLRRKHTRCNLLLKEPPLIGSAPVRSHNGRTNRWVISIGSIRRFGFVIIVVESACGYWIKIVPGPTLSAIQANYPGLMIPAFRLADNLITAVNAVCAIINNS